MVAVFDANHAAAKAQMQRNATCNLVSLRRWQKPVFIAQISVQRGLQWCTYVCTYSSH